MLQDYPILQTAITVTLWWLAIGSIFWAIFFVSSAFEQWARYRKGSRRVPAPLDLLIASAVFIAAWPVPVGVAIGAWAMARRAMR